MVSWVKTCVFVQIHMSGCLCDDHTFLDTWTLGPLQKCWPQVGRDGVTLGVGTVEPHMQICLKLSRLILDTVGRILKILQNSIKV